MEEQLSYTWSIEGIYTKYSVSYRGERMGEVYIPNNISGDMLGVNEYIQKIAYYYNMAIENAKPTSKLFKGNKEIKKITRNIITTKSKEIEMALLYKERLIVKLYLPLTLNGDCYNITKLESKIGLGYRKLIKI